MVAFETEILNKVDVDLPLFVAEIDLSLLFTYLQKNSGHRKLFEEPSKFPSFSYDAAFIVQKDLQVEELSKTIKQTAGDSLQELFVFDLYEGESIGKDKKSVAFRMTFLDRNKTLSSTEVEPIVQKIVKILDSKFSAKLRS
jgi:phenylalanyl-tRNA synthetase beta chain